MLGGEWRNADRMRGYSNKQQESTTSHPTTQHQITTVCMMIKSLTSTERNGYNICSVQTISQQSSDKDIINR